MIHVAKTKAMISCTVTAQLICAFVFRIGKNPVSHDAAHFFHRDLERKMLNFKVIFPLVRIEDEHLSNW